VSAILGEKKISNITTNLLMTMSANGRIGDAAKVANAFVELMETARGSVNAIIISAEALKKPQAKEVETAIISMVGKGKKVDITYKQDPNIIGGLQIVIGDRVMDLSIAARVTELNMVLESSDS
jgi:F-type H+-transporting ATPase subunit O